jgi:flagellar biosynthesis anti-sigma factor FlgM
MKIVRKDTTASIYAFLNKLNDNILQKEHSTAPLSETSGENKVILSPQAREIQVLKNYMKKIPDVRAKKVADLKKQIETGIYLIDSQAIALKMMQESLIGQIL